MAIDRARRLGPFFARLLVALAALHLRLFDVRARFGTPSPQPIARNLPLRLVRADLGCQGREVEVDGKPGELWRANQLFRRVTLPQGRHHVGFRLRLFSFSKMTAVVRDAIF